MSALGWADRVPKALQQQVICYTLSTDHHVQSGDERLQRSSHADGPSAIR